MWIKRIKDIIAMLLIGDGALTLIGARNRALVWRFGPEGLRKSTGWQADHPLLMRLEGAVSIGLGVLLAWWQYREPLDPRLSVAVGRVAERQRPSRVFLRTSPSRSSRKVAQPRPNTSLAGRTRAICCLLACVISSRGVKATLSQATRLRGGCRERCPPWAKATAPTTTHSAAANTRI